MLSMSTLRASRAVELGFESRVTPSELGRLEEAAPVMNYNSSLYIPAVVT